MGVPAVQGDAPAPDPRSADDGGDCFATPAIADLVHAETGVKLMGCALLEIAREAMEQPELLQNAPYNTPVRRLDEAGAAKALILRWPGTVIYPQEVPACAC